MKTGAINWWRSACNVARRGSAVRLGLALLVAAVAAIATQSGATRPVTADWDNETSVLLTMINNYRQENGRPPLVLDAKLQAAADWHANDQMNTANCLDNFRCDHRDTQGRGIDGRIWGQFGYPRTARIGENIAMGYRDAQGAFDGWRSSPGHNNNMLEGRFRAAGLSRLCRPDGSCIWVNTFGSEVSEAFTPTTGPAAPAGPTTYEPQPPTADMQVWIGAWKTDRGDLNLNPPQAWMPHQAPLFGMYGADKSVEGEVFGAMFGGTWFEPAPWGGFFSGDFEFRLSPDGKSFTGRYRFPASENWEPWNGHRP